MLKELIDVAAGRRKADIVLKNAKIADVFTQSVIEGDVALCGEQIAGIGVYEGEREIDLQGSYVLPGLIDAHVHIESSMVTPVQYARAVISHGITTVIADPHEIANVRGIEGIEFMIENSKQALIDVWFAAPSCVPATDIGTNGATLDAEEIKKLLKNPKVRCLGEMMNYPGVICADAEVLKKIQSAVIVDGHAPMVEGNELNAYIGAGVSSDHECVSAQEAREKISKGMLVLVREGSLAKDLVRLAEAIDAHTMHRMAFCTDDRSIADISEEGTIDHCIRKAIALGVDPLAAVTMASKNAAQHYGLKGYGAVAPGYFADLVVKPSIESEEILYVLKKGREVLSQVDQRPSSAPMIPPNLTHTVLLPSISAQTITDLAPQKYPVAIEIVADTIITNEIRVLPEYREERFYNSDGSLLNITVAIDRYGKTGGMAACLIKGFEIQDGAIAMTIGHDAHNLSAVGDTAKNIAVAINALGDQGGIAIVKDERVIQTLVLDVCGILSSKSFEEVRAAHHQIDSALEQLSIAQDKNPLISLSFLSLTVIPHLRLTDAGLYRSPGSIVSGD